MRFLFEMEHRLNKLNKKDVQGFYPSCQNIKCKSQQAMNFPLPWSR